MDSVGLVSLGIQVCQGLLKFYNDWKSQKSDISSTYEAVAELKATLTILETTLSSGELETEKRERVKKSLECCNDSLVELSSKLQKLQKHSQPAGFLQKARSEVERASYPFKSSTLMKIKEIVNDAQERLKLALEVLHLDVSISSKSMLARVASDTNDIVARIGVIEAQNQDLLARHQSGQFKEIIAWLSPPDPWTNHDAARRRHEPQTGVWLLQSSQYKDWKSGSTRNLWVHGKPGCGKTILCSTAVEDMRSYGDTADVGLAIFYFTFSDNQKQSHGDMVLSLVAQLGHRGPGLSMLRQARDKGRPLSLDELEKIVILSIDLYDKVFVLIDALDECPEDGDARADMLDYLARLSQKARKLRIFSTSREVPDITESMERLNAVSIFTDTKSMNADIRKYVSTQISRHRKLSRLDSATRTEIEEWIARHAGGMFRWADCQLRELKALPSMKPKYIKETLRSLPPTLDATYERMLIGIKPMFRREALILLRWITYAKRPLTLRELTEVTVIDPTAATCVDIGERGGLEDTLNLLSGLVTTEAQMDETGQTFGSDFKDDKHARSRPSPLEDSKINVAPESQRYLDNTEVRLAHFSVKEYLESRISQSKDVGEFYLESDITHQFIAQSCLVYLMHYSGSRKLATREDLISFPLLQYVATSWHFHSALQGPGDFAHEMSLFGSRTAMRDWIHVYEPSNFEEFDNADLFRPRKEIGSSLLYASLFGLDVVVEKLLEAGCDINASSPLFPAPLIAASLKGHEEVLRILIEAGADINVRIPGKLPDTALFYTCMFGHTKITRMLVEAGADVNDYGSVGTPLQVASQGDYSEIVRILIDAGADVNAVAAPVTNLGIATIIFPSTALHHAAENGFVEIARELIHAGANVNIHCEYDMDTVGTALHAACDWGRAEIVQILIDAGADVNVLGSLGTALDIASKYVEIMGLLIEAVTESNALEALGTALCRAFEKGTYNAWRVLSGAEVGGKDPGKLYAAIEAHKPLYHALSGQSGHSPNTITQLLIEAGIDVNGTALLEGCNFGYLDIMRSLINADAVIDPKRVSRTALQMAAEDRNDHVVHRL